MKTLTLTALLMTALLAVPSVTRAQWVKVDSAEPATIYADPSSLQRFGSFARMWELVDYNQTEDFGGQGFRSSRVLREFDCDMREMRTLAFTIFTGQMARGDVVHSHREDNSKWELVEPYSLGESSFLIACDKDK